MLKKFLSSLLIISLLFGLNTFTVFSSENSQKQMEYLTRGAIGASIDGNIYLSWRLLGTEPSNTKFNIYCNDEKIVSELDNTNYTHIGGSSYNKYQISAVINGQEQALCDDVTILSGYRDSNWKNSPYAYFDIPVTAPNADNCSYYDANDASVGDLDCDGEYEIILKWDPDNSKDNSNSGVTGTVYIDAYETDGTLLWRINLGRNIRAGAHYTQYIVYDFDGDGKSEIAMKTAPGSKDGQGNYVTEVGTTDEIKNADNSKVYVNSKGFILDGPEYLTIFDGKTGTAMQTIDYKPNRVCDSYWGDNSATQGNRVDRFLAGVAYLDGVHPSLLVCRGYYSRSAVTAYDWDGKNLTERWAYDTGSNKKDPFFGQGNHQLSVADVDNDGFDEIIYGSAALDHDGKVLHSTGWGHGDALHVSDFNNDGEQDIFSVLEDSPDWGTGLRKGNGDIYWKQTATSDTGRGVMANISKKYGALGWSSQGVETDSEGKKTYYAWDFEGNKVSFSGNSNCTPNFAVYWDGDLLRELADGTKIIKWNDETDTFDRLWSIGGVSTNNYTKNTPCLQADLFGDWREEMIFRLPDNSALRVFTSITPTDYKIPTLMHDSQYRCAVAWQNVGYNQPPHQSFYIGPDKTQYEIPSIETAYSKLVSFKITTSDSLPIEGAKIEINKNIVVITNSEGMAEIPILPGDYTYSVKCLGYEPITESKFTVNENSEITNVENSMNTKTDCSVLVSFSTEDKKELKPNESLGVVAINSEYVLDEKYKEDITVNGITYEYNPNLSSDTSLKMIDDTEIKLVFSEKTLPDKLGKEYYKTNFSKNGYLASSEKYGYTTTGEVQYGSDSNGVKYGTYSIGDNTITINLSEGVSNFVAEFDMAYSATSTESGGAVFGITPFNKKGQGPTIGVRLNGSLVPQFGAYAGGSNIYMGSNVQQGKVLRYVLECDGTKLYLTVGDKQTGQIVQEKITISSLRNLSDLSTNKINKFVFNRGYGSGNSNISLGDFKVYEIGGPNNIKWSLSDDITLNIPSQTSFAPEEVNFVTGIKNYTIDVSGKVTYELKNSDNSEVSAESGVSIDENGLLNISENSPKGNYKVICKYNDTVIKEFNVTATRNGMIELYNSTNDTTGEFFKYLGDSGASLSYSNNQWTFNQDSVGGREFEGDFYASNSGEATLKFTFATGGKKDANNAWDWTGREYGYEIQLLDSEYNGEKPEEHISLAFSQKYDATKVNEVQYYTNSITPTNVKNSTKQVTVAEPNITARSSTTWNVTVNFNFDKNTATFIMTDTNGDGYKYENVAIGNGFKTLRFISTGDSTVQWGPKIKDVSYSKFAYEPDPVSAKSVDVKYSENGLSVNFDKPYDGGAPATYKVSLIDSSNGNVVYQKETDTIPVEFENGTVGNYNVEISVSNLIGESVKTLAGPFEVTVQKDPIEISVDNKNISSEGILSFNANVTNNVDSQTGVVFAVIYNSDGVMIDSSHKEGEIKAGINTFNFDLDTKNNSGVILKVFVWDSIENMQPIYDTHSLNINI